MLDGCEYIPHVEMSRKSNETLNEKNSLNIKWLNEAIQLIKKGIANKLEKDNIQIYRVFDSNNDIIRIDINGE